MQNVTDVDDPPRTRGARLCPQGRLERPGRRGDRALPREDMTALGVMPRMRLVGVVRSIDLIAAAVRELVDAGSAYRLPVTTPRARISISIWLRRTKFRLHQPVDPRADGPRHPGARGDPDRPGKRDPLDPLVWRSARPGEPSWTPAGLPPGRRRLASTITPPSPPTGSASRSTSRAAAATWDFQTTG
ncbi:MAG: hypothetical protein IPH03_13780 [Tetrasphaera sp.]|nr:hypothetical protein [Tetrasphaera sp.]